MDYGSFQNQQYTLRDNPDPEVGMGATEISWTDRHAYTVIEIISPRRIRVQEDTSTRTDSNGMSEVQSYDFTPNLTGRIETLTKRKDGTWRVMGSQRVFTLGIRMQYHDYSF